MSFGQWLKEHLTIKETSACTGASQTMASKWRNNHSIPSVPNWYLIAYRVAEKHKIEVSKVLEDMYLTL